MNKLYFVIFSMGIWLILLKSLDGKNIESSYQLEDEQVPDVENSLDMNPIAGFNSEEMNMDYAESEAYSKVEGLTNPENYFIWWLPGLSKLGLELDILKAKVAQIYLKDLYKIKSGNDCSEEDSTNTTALENIQNNLKDISSTLKNMVELSSSIKIVKDVDELEKFDDAISIVLSESIDALGMRQKATKIFQNAQNLLKVEKRNRSETGSCQWTIADRKKAVVFIDKAISEYWLQVIPTASSVYWDEYSARDKKNLEKLIQDMF